MNDEKLQQQIQHAYANSKAFRRRMEAAGVKPEQIKGVADLALIPVMTKDELIQLQREHPPFGDVLAVAPSELRHIFFSPGPLYEPDVAGGDEAVLAVAAAAFREGGFEAGDIVLNTLSYHLVPAGSMVDHALVTLGCTVIPGGVGNSDLQLKMMHDLGVTAYAGTPSFLAQLIEKAEGAGYDFKRDFKLTKAFVSAEPLPPTLRQRLVERYGIHVVNGYGTAELGFLAVDSEGQMAMRLLPQPIIQVVDPDTGATVGAGNVGEVVVTNNSRAYPLIRFGTGDMAVNGDPNPGGSRQEERTITLVGRRGEAVKVRGMFVHPNQLRFAAARVLQHQGIQGVIDRPQHRDRFVVRVVSSEQEKEEALKSAIQHVCRVRVDAIEFVEALAEGEPAMLDRRSWQ